MNFSKKDFFGNMNKFSVFCGFVYWNKILHKTFIPNKTKEFFLKHRLWFIISINVYHFYKSSLSIKPWIAVIRYYQGLPQEDALENLPF